MKTSYIKYIYTFCLFVVLLGISACGKSSADNMIPVSPYDGQLVCTRGYIAYITEDARVCLITKDGSGVMDSFGSVRKIDGTEGSLVLLFEDGTMAYYNVTYQTFITGENYEERGYERCLPALELIWEAQNVTDFYYNGYDEIVLLQDGEWYYGENESRQALCKEWNDKKVVKFAGAEGQGGPSIGLCSDGTVWVDEWYGNESAGISRDKVAAWTDLVDVDFAFDAFGLKKDGTVLAADWHPYNGGNVANWSDIRQISCDTFVTAGLTGEGKVMVESYQNESLKQAEEWQNIKYVVATADYILGIESDGSFHITEQKDIQLLKEGTDYPSCRQVKSTE